MEHRNLCRTAQATASVGIINGGIQQIFLSNRGKGFTFAPRVAISSAPSGGLTGIATSKLLAGLLLKVILVIVKNQLFSLLT